MGLCGADDELAGFAVLPCPSAFCQVEFYGAEAPLRTGKNIRHTYACKHGVAGDGDAQSLDESSP